MDEPTNDLDLNHYYNSNDLIRKKGMSYNAIQYMVFRKQFPQPALKIGTVRFWKKTIVDDWFSNNTVRKYTKRAD